MDDVFEKRKFVICEESLENVIQDGKQIGFSLKLRIPEYRGLPLALIGGIRIFIDGNLIPEEMISITSDGATFKWSEISTVRSVYWLYEEPALITVIDNKGLSKGTHKVGAYVEVRISYMPPGIFAGEEREMEVRNAD